MTRSACAIVLSVALLAPLVAWLLQVYQVSPAQRQLAAVGMVAGQDCLPEPGERMAYVLSCLLAPLLLIGGSYGLSNISWSDSRATRVAGALLNVSLAVGLLATVWIGLTAEDRFFLTGNVFYERPWLACLIAALAAAGFWISRRIGPLPAVIRRVLAVLCCGAVGLACVSGVANRYVWQNFHFSVVFDPVSQVCLGQHLLVDSDSQYGLYADFMSPLFGVIGLSIARFTCVLGILGACSYAAIWMMLDGAISRPWLKWLGPLALVYNGWALFQLKLLPMHPDYFDCYFQYMPLRFCFPAGLLLLYWSWLKQPRTGLYWFTACFLSVGVLWNVDSGAVAWLAWLLALCYQACQLPNLSLRLRAILGHALKATAALLVVIAAYSVAKYLAAGQWPDFARLFSYQRLFYMRGFNMLPMPLPGMWMLVALVYLAGIARGLAALAAGDRAPKAAMIFLISVLGCGLFSYFQGRSHALVLLLAWWPSLVLLPLLMDEALDSLRIQPRNAFAWTAAGLMGCFMLSSVVSFVRAVPTLGGVIGQQLATLGDSHSPVIDDAKLLKQYVARDDALLILSYRASLVHWAARIPSIAPSSAVQMLETEQYRRLSEALDSPKRTWLLLDRNFEDLVLIGTKANPGAKLLLDHVSSRMRRAGENGQAYLYEITPAPPADGQVLSRMTTRLQSAER